jgi:hypothetical protein
MNSKHTPGLKVRPKNIKEVWSLLDKGIKVYWSNDSYQLIPIEASPKNEYAVFSFRNGRALRCTCMENWFGSLLDKSEFGSVYYYKDKK